MPLAATLEGSTYELDEVDLTWTLHEFRDALANACGSFKIFDADEWRVRKGLDDKKDDLVGETLSLLQHGVPLDATLNVVRVAASSRPPGTSMRKRVVEGPPPESLTARFDVVIDIDEQPHTNQIYGVRTRLRDDACDRELERLPDAKRAVYLAVDAMLKKDEKRRVLDAAVCGAVVEVLLVDG